MTKTYRLYIAGVAQPDYAEFTKQGNKDVHDVNQVDEHFPDHEWRREDRQKGTAFEVINLDGERIRYLSFADFYQQHDTNAYSRRVAAYIRKSEAKA